MTNWVRWLHRIENGILTVLVLILVALAGAQIFMRNAFGGGFSWADPFLRTLVVWTAMLGALAAVRDDKHIAVDVLQRFLPPSVSAEAAEVLSGMIPLLQQYSWPGNVRELFNFSQRLQFYHHDYAAHGDAKQFLAEILPNAAQEWDIATRQSAGWLDQMAQIEKQTIEEVLRQSANSAEAATKLGMSRATLWRKIRRLKLDDQPRS